MGLGQFADLRGRGLARKNGVVFLKGGEGDDTAMHTVYHLSNSKHVKNTHGGVLLLVLK